MLILLGANNMEIEHEQAKRSKGMWRLTQGHGSKFFGLAFVELGNA